MIDEIAGKRSVVFTAVVLLLLIVWNPTAAAAEPEEPAEKTENNEQTIDRLEKEIRELRELVGRLTEERRRETEQLQRRLLELEESLRQQQEAQGDEELDAILAEAEAATAEEARRDEEAEGQRQTFTGRQRALQALNPEISFLGDVTYDWTDTEVRDQFLVRGVEISFQAPLDPYTRFKGFLAGHQEPAELEHEEEVVPGEEEEGHGHGHGDEINLAVEEAYMEWVALPSNMRLRVGKFRQQFGTLNRWHPHALPSVDVPFAIRNAFGHDGLVGLGVGLDWQLPGLWASSHSLLLEVVNADNASAFAGSSFRDPAVLLRHTGFFDFGPDAYLEIGLNGMIGPNDEQAVDKTGLGSLDFNFVWEPVNRAKYRGLEIRGELIRERFEHTDTETGIQDAFRSDSLYTYVTWKLSRRWNVGARYDDAELPSPRLELFDDLEFSEGLRERAWSPFVTFWQSEFVRLRFQYQHTSRDFTWAHGPDDDDRLWLQVTFAAGPHKHEAY